MDTPVAFLRPDWPQYAARLRDAVRDLSDEQLALSAGPEHGSIWQLAAHIAGARVYWLCHIFGEPGGERTPFPVPFAPGWEDFPDQPRSGAELAWALDSSWEVIAGCLARWTLADLERSVERPRDDGTVQTHTRASVLDRLCSHDAFHAGEISQLLGVHHLPPIDLWVRRV